MDYAYPNGILELWEVSGTVNINELADELKIASMLVEADDTYIFYFSGHGNNGTLALQ